VQKLWALLFGVVLLGCFVLTLVALFVVPDKWGLPENIAAEYGGPVDDLFFMILAFVGFFFVLTEVILVYAMYKFGRGEGATRATYTHGNHKLELAWTIIPSAILLYIAFAQITTWEKMKYQSHFPQPDQVVQVTAHQWEWRMRYAAEDNVVKGWQLVPKDERSWAETAEFDDVYDANDLHTWKGAKCKILLKTTDIIHSFFLPNLRLKQDALPGKTIPMWFMVDKEFNYHFDADKPNKRDVEKGRDWEIACAELCGGGHYRMRGKLFVHDTKENYEAWLKYTKAQENSRQITAPAPAE
jgi:cytochrome c oxidase subunit II